MSDITILIVNLYIKCLSSIVLGDISYAKKLVLHIYALMSCPILNVRPSLRPVVVSRICNNRCPVSLYLLKFICFLL